LSNIGLGLGTILEVLVNVPNKPIIVYVRGTRLALSRLIASRILVEHENN
jgi:Fe2+ transport system protein FeoA